ncbi:winged helix-turn-helix transcriptional regulator, partial [Litorivivens sp.]
MTYSALAEEVGLSTSPCMERVKKLERLGVIRGYHAQVDPEVLNAGLVVLVQIRLDRKSRNIFREFSKAAARLPQVQECFLVSGNFDYLIKARV